MRALLVAFLCGLLVWAGAAAETTAQIPQVRVTAVRIDGSGLSTRVVIESDRALTHHVFALSAGASRVVIDLPRVRWSLNGLTAEAGSGAGAGVIQGFRYAHNTSATSRLVLDLARPALVTRQRLVAPKSPQDQHRLVLDLNPVSAAEFARVAEPDRPTPAPAVSNSVRKPLVVIDPGHGGKDPGATSVSGLREKDITLAIALELREALVASERYDVALTRSSDIFIDLEDRVTKARNLGADLFIALHADAGSNSATSGASVYTLSPEGEKRVDGARRQNDWVLDVEVDSSRPEMVNQILADLVQRETKNQSARFAQMLAGALAEMRWPTLQNAHRKRGFYVLLSPDVPAALLEMGFITNESDAAAMTSQAGRARLVGGITNAINAFFEGQSRLLAAN